MAAHAGTYPWSNTGDSTWDTPETGFRAHSDRSPKRAKLLARAETAFDTSLPDRGKIADIEGCGHISRLEYAFKDLLLKVSFEDGAVVVYEDVPESIAGELFHHAYTGQVAQSPVDGSYRHLLGIRFWDLIRIRGRKYGARKPFEYVARSPYKLTRSSNRYRVKLTAENFKALFPDKNKWLMEQAIHGIKPGEEIETILNEEEYSRILGKLEEDEHSRKRAAEASAGISTVYDESGRKTGITDSRYDVENMAFSEERAALRNEARSKPVTAYSDDERAKLMDYISSEFDKRFSEFNNTDEVAKALASARLRMSEPDALRRVLTQFNRDDLRQMIDWRTNDFRMKTGQGDRWLAGMLNVVDGPGAYGRWRKENSPHEYAFRSNGRGWTIQQLKDFANYTVPGNIDERHAKRYKDLIRMQDWEGALDFLKEHKARWTYTGVNKYGNAEEMDSGYRPYAKPQDFVDFEKE